LSTKILKNLGMLKKFRPQKEGIYYNIYVEKSLFVQFFYILFFLLQTNFTSQRTSVRFRVPLAKGSVQFVRSETFLHIP